MKKYISTCLVFLTYFNSFGQIGIGTTTPNTSAALDVTSTTKGILIPRMTQAQRTAIGAPATGLMVYQTDATTGFWFYNGASWQSFSGGNVWGLTGNAGTVVGTNKLGPTDNQSFVFKANNTEVMRILGSNYIGMGTTTPTSQLYVTKAPTMSFNDGFEDNTIPPFATSGNKNWTIQNTVFNSGSRAGKAGAITDSQTTNIDYTTAAIPATGGILTFYYKVDSESCCDKLRFFVDGTEIINWGGAINWTQYTYALTSGAHTLRWQYSKDSSIATGTDTAYLDDVVITLPDGVITIQDGNQANNYLMISDASGNGVWTNPSVFATADDDWRFASGSLVTDPIYRTGNVGIGNSVGYASLLDIEEPTFSAAGTEVGVGNVEYFMDRSSEITISHNIAPMTDNSISMGSAALRWSAIYASNGVINTSDIREKENIRPLSYGTAQLMKLKPVSYDWKKEVYLKTVATPEQKKHKIGFLAQDLQLILPEVVQTTQWRENQTTHTYEKQPMPRFGVSYSEILPVVIKTTQEQNQKLVKIKEQLDQIDVLLKETKN